MTTALDTKQQKKLRREIHALFAASDKLQARIINLALPFIEGAEVVDIIPRDCEQAPFGVCAVDPYGEPDTCIFCKEVATA